MLYIIFTTGQCNLKCKYCGGSFPLESIPWEVKYPIDYLKRFISDDPEPIIAFYGGEPLLNTKFIMKTMDKIPDVRYVIQTNGTLTEKLEYRYWSRFDAILLSIDGRKEITEYSRGVNVYEQVVNTARWLRSFGFNNDLIARMTLSELNDVYIDVVHLLSLNLFDHIHWQLDVIWDSRWKDFDGWCVHSYLPGLSKLIQLWITKAKKGNVLGIIPFLSILKTIIKDEEVGCPPCGAGTDSVAILTNGDILACPIAVDTNWAKLGNILKSSNTKIMEKIKMGDPCDKCKYLKYCGGRCLYTHLERLWGERGFKKICRLTRNLIDELDKIKHKVSELIDRKIISIEQIDYPSFNNSTELIP